MGLDIYHECRLLGPILGALKLDLFLLRLLGSCLPSTAWLSSFTISRQLSRRGGVHHQRRGSMVPHGEGSGLLNALNTYIHLWPTEAWQGTICLSYYILAVSCPHPQNWEHRSKRGQTALGKTLHHRCLRG